MRKVTIVSLQRLEMPAPAIYVPYVYGVLRTFVEQSDDLRAAYSFEAPLWRMESVERMLSRIDEPDVVGFSVYVWNFRNSLRLARAVKERWPSCLVVFGGPHVPNEPSDFFGRNPFVDVCVHGEGEQAFRDLLRARLSSAPDLHSVRGISFLHEGRQIFTAPAERLRVLDAPGPYHAGCFEGFLDEVRALPMPVNILAALETTRGCPYTCAFCDWGMSTMSKIRQHPTEKVEAELDWIAARGISTVILNDSNFGIFERDLRLMEHVVALRGRTGFPQAFYPLGFAKNDKERAFHINRLIQDGGLDPLGYNVNFSLQTLDSRALAAIGRKNISLESYRSLSDTYAHYGYTLSPDLILPLPGETLASFKSGYADLASWGHVQRIRIYPCTVLPNAPMAKAAYREQWGLVTRTSPLAPQQGLRAVDDVEAEFVETVVATSTMTEEDVAEAKLFVAVVDALEVYGLTRWLRTYVQRLTGLGGDVFYDRLMRWQLVEEGVLADAIREVWGAAAASAYADQVAWSGAATTWDGRRMQLHKVIAYDALTHTERFVDELRRFAVDQFGLEDDAALDDLLRWQSDAWIRVGHDATRERIFTYRWDWASWLRGASERPVARPTMVRFEARTDWVASGYAPTLEGWLRFALAQDEVDSHLVTTPPTQTIAA